MQHGGRRAGAGRNSGPPTKVVRLPVPIANFARQLAVQARGGEVGEFLAVAATSALRVPLMAWSAACGFPSPAEDYVDRPLDFNELLIKHPAATFAIRIEGDSMTGAGIFPGDIVVVDRAKKPVNGCIVLALLDGSFTIKRYWQKRGAAWLQAENPTFPDMPLSETSAFEVWGVITRSIRML
jgi:DNA polymerase V